MKRWNEIAQKRDTSITTLSCILQPTIRDKTLLSHSVYNSTMTAIDLTRLEKQIEALLLLADDPPAFQAEFHNILGFYHRYSHRKHKDSLPKSFMRQYDLPEKVLPSLQNRLKRIQPELILPLARQLWQDSYFEAKDTAVTMLGFLPPDHNEEVLEQILQWLDEPLDRAIIESIFTRGIKTLSQNAPQLWQDEVNKLLLSERTQRRKMGLLALAKIIPDCQSDSLPAYFSWMRPFLISPDQSLDNNLKPVVAALAKRSNQETAYLLREILTDSNDIEVGRRFRHYLEFFEGDSYERLLEAIKKQVILPRTKID